MRKRASALFPLLALALPVTAAELSANGISLPEGYKDWQRISINQRTDNQTLRVIPGNHNAVKAARCGLRQPSPATSVIPIS